MSREEIKAQLDAKGIKYHPNLGEAKLQALLDSATEDLPAVPSDAPEETVAETPAPKKTSYDPDEVKELIAEALRMSKQEKPEPKKKDKGHRVNLCRLEGKWIVDFVNHQDDEYKTTPKYSWVEFNKRGEAESWIEPKFLDDTSKKMKLNHFVENIIGISLEVVKTDIVDASYVTGKVERKRDVGGKLVPTGEYIDQVVKIDERFYTVDIPTVGLTKVPEYIVNHK